MKKKKILTKVMAVVFALAILFAMSVPALAADNVYSGSGNANALITGTEIPFTKGIVVFNTDGSQIREPNISYTYTVTPVDETTANQGKPLPGVTVTDATTPDPITVNVNDGVAAAFTTSLTLAFSSETNAKVTAAVNGTEIEKTGNLTINPSAFPNAGVFRFKITETVAPTDVTTVGLDARDSDYNSVRFLDVYIRNNSTSGNPEMYAAVIFKKSSATDATDETNGDITPSSEKTTGFEPGGDPSASGSGTYTYEDDVTVDKYHTYNLEVNKTISGSLANKNNDFPFVITLTGNKAAAITADYTKTGATYVGTEPTTVAINTTAKVLTPAISNGDSVKITGIPVGTTVLVKETNNTTDKYTPSISTQTGFSGLTLTTTGLLDANASTQMSAAAAITDKTQNSVIGLTNTLSELSPTGLVFRVAPYVLMLLAGVSLILIFTKRRREVTDMI